MISTLDATGARRETIRYSTYGVPFGMLSGDVNGSGGVGILDRSLINTQIGKAYGVSGYTVLLDVDLDGDVDINDWNIANSQGLQSLGHGALSQPPTSANGGNRIGYAGYAWEPAASKYAVRHRVFDPLRGRWSRRDPLGYVDSPTMYAYVNNAAMTMVDPRGQRAKPGLTQGAECLPPNDNYHGDMQFKQVNPASPLGPEQTDPDPRNCQLSGGTSPQGSNGPKMSCFSAGSSTECESCCKAEAKRETEGHCDPINDDAAAHKACTDKVAGHLAACNRGCQDIYKEIPNAKQDKDPTNDDDYPEYPTGSQLSNACGNKLPQDGSKPTAGHCAAFGSCLTEQCNAAKAANWTRFDCGRWPNSDDCKYTVPTFDQFCRMDADFLLSGVGCPK